MNEDEKKALCRQIDISCVRAFHTKEEIDVMILLAKKYHFAAVFALPCYTAYVADKLMGYDDIHVGGVVSFPSGGADTAVKALETKDLIAKGCKEIDMVMNLGLLKNGGFNAVKDDISAVRNACPNAILKVIIEAPQLSDEEIKSAVQICIEAKADYVKSSTGWYSEHPTTVRDIEAMAKYADGKIKIKAAGGIRSLETIRKMQNLGCSRFGLGVKGIGFVTDL